MNVERSMTPESAATDSASVTSIPDPSANPVAQSSSPASTGEYKLDSDRVLQTIAQLQSRIEERFPAAGLGQVCRELHSVARDTRKTATAIAQPMWGLRAFIFLVIVVSVGFMLIGFSYLDWNAGRLDLAEFITLTEAAFNDLILIGAAILFLVTIESRVKRSRALTAIHRLRSIAHIIDMHQLTKDPERLLHPERMSDTASSPKRSYSQFELGRYLDYCSEMLSLTGKVAALYVEQFPDSQAVRAVNELESLTTGLSRKIWQKIMLLNSDSHQ